ncbi:MAG: heme lyase CcmF/NrfE family subunit [Alphaproteobacteria bacterium]|nr:heme lyase CcmF/NrfE family subunit [Alphaproteobacteria bacterium]
MITEIGHLALILALVVAILQSSLPLYGAAQNRAALMQFARHAAIGQLGLVLLAFLATTYAFVVSDFSVMLVANNSHSAKPMLYKITGVWANHEGSLLLWILILAVFGAMVAGFGRNLPPTLRARVLAVQAMIAVGFIAFTLFSSNPFTRLWPPPIDGKGLNPLLQDPGLAFHPPFLYFGYVGFSITFSFAIAALIEGRVDPAWARWVRPWTLWAWCGLTFGIALGSWWAYYELGWGGFWFWDPVENASFMPWLAGTALLHSAIVVEKRDALKSWTILLAIVAFSLSLIGTFLVRSGVLTSVHAFATDPARGVFILVLLVIAIGGSFALYAVRAPTLKGGGLFQPISREGALVLNNLGLTVALATVFLGTMYPLFLDAMGSGKVSVGPPFFNSSFVPIMVPVLVAMAIGPQLAWKRGDLAGALGRLWAAFGAAAGIAMGGMLLTGGGDILAVLGLAVVGFVLMGVAIEWAERVRLFQAPLAESWRRARAIPRAAYGMSIAHSGIALVMLAIIATTVWRTEVIQVMRAGEQVNVAGYEFAFEGVRDLNGPNYQAQRGTFQVARNGRFVATLEAEKRFFPVENQATTEAAIHTTWFADLYAVVGDPDGSGGWTVRLYHNPMVPWIWIGAVVMVMGGLVSLTDRRHRVGAPATRRRRAIDHGMPQAAGD